jgi:hypothetical protein
MARSAVAVGMAAALALIAIATLPAPADAFSVAPAALQLRSATALRPEGTSRARSNLVCGARASADDQSVVETIRRRVASSLSGLYTSPPLLLAARCGSAPSEDSQRSGTAVLGRSATKPVLACMPDRGSGFEHSTSILFPRSGMDPAARRCCSVAAQI